MDQNQKAEKNREHSVLKIGCAHTNQTGDKH